MKNYYQIPKPCPNNDAVFCSDQSKCTRCGWNPDVAAQRLQEIKQGNKTERGSR